MKTKNDIIICAKKYYMRGVPCEEERNERLSKRLWQKRVTNYKRLKKRFKRIVKMFEQLDYNRVRSLDNEKLLQWMKWTNKNLKWTEDFFVGKLVNMILLQLTFSLIAYCTRDIVVAVFSAIMLAIIIISAFVMLRAREVQEINYIILSKEQNRRSW